MDFKNLIQKFCDSELMREIEEIKPMQETNSYRVLLAGSTAPIYKDLVATETTLKFIEGSDNSIFEEKDLTSHWQAFITKKLIGKEKEAYVRLCTEKNLIHLEEQLKDNINGFVSDEEILNCSESFAHIMYMEEQLFTINLGKLSSTFPASKIEEELRSRDARFQKVFENYLVQLKEKKTYLHFNDSGEEVRSFKTENDEELYEFVKELEKDSLFATRYRIYKLDQSEGIL